MWGQWKLLENTSRCSSKSYPPSKRGLAGYFNIDKASLFLTLFLQTNHLQSTNANIPSLEKPFKTPIWVLIYKTHYAVKDRPIFQWYHIQGSRPRGHACGSIPELSASLNPFEYRMAIHYATEGLSVRSGDTIVLSKTLHTAGNLVDSQQSLLYVGPPSEAFSWRWQRRWWRASLVGYVIEQATSFCTS